MPKKFTYDEHKKRMLDIVNRSKQTAQADRRGILKKILQTARSKRARV